MCQTRNITYACGHYLTFRLSTCRGVFTYQRRKGQEPAALCSSPPQITARSTWRCGACEREAAEKQLDQTIAATRERLRPKEWAEDEPEELIAAEAEYGRQIHLIEKQFPQGTWKKAGRPEKGGPSTWSVEQQGPSTIVVALSKERRTRSLLRQEVKAEDVVCGYEANKYAVGGGWDDWGEGAVSLEDELAQLESEKLELGLPPSCPGDAWEACGYGSIYGSESAAHEACEHESVYGSESAMQEHEMEAAMANEDDNRENIPLRPRRDSAKAMPATSSTLADISIRAQSSTPEQDEHGVDHEAVNLFQQMHIGMTLAMSS